MELRSTRAPRRSLPSLVRPAAWAGLSLALGVLGACNSGGSGDGQIGTPGQEASKPNGDAFFVDPNQGGNATRLRITQLFWGRLVDIHDVDAVTGETDPVPIHRDLVVNENVLSDQSNYLLETNPITQKTRLIIQRTKPDTIDPAAPSQFEVLLRTAADANNMPPIQAKNDDGTSAPPFSFMARNATLVIRFDDLLNDGPASAEKLEETVRVLTGYPPRPGPGVPFQTRILFDPNYGSLVNGAFHSTRVLVDMTVSDTEATTHPFNVQVNSLGLPASLQTTGQPNVSVRIPSRVDFGSGVFELLTNLSGKPMATSGNGPVDFGIGSQDVVRALRAGNQIDTNNGFLLDLNPPEVAGGWPLSLDLASNDPSGTEGVDFVIDLTFSTICRAAPAPGDILSLNGRFLEVSEQAGAPNPVTGKVSNVRVQVLGTELVSNPGLLVGGGLFLSTFDPATPVDTGCWISFAPQPGAFPATGVKTSAQVLVRFTEPMDPDSIQPFDTFVLVRQPVGVPADATDVVVGDIQASSDLREFTFTPLLPFNHSAGTGEEYHVELMGGTAGVTDLAGNALDNTLPFLSFFIDPLEADQNNGGIVLRFSSTNEVMQNDPDPINGNNDIRGQFFYDLDRGVIFPRNVIRESFVADRVNPVPSIMIPFPPGVQTPLSPLGSKLMTVWRYADLGFNVRDETRYNLDVEGLAWAPVGGQVVADFYDQFEIRLSHSARLPDEYIDVNLLPAYPGSGVLDSPNQYTANILVDPASPQKVVHPRSLGYQVSPVNLFTASSGTQMMPYPLNRGVTGDPNSYTWRDTTVLALAGPQGSGIPLDIEIKRPLFIDPGPKIANVTMVPSFGLPLLMEFRCFPSDSGVGLNAFDISLAVNSSSRPNFRAFSTGGLNSAGIQVFKDPDLELVPDGGFNPNSNGAPTPAADNSFYVGRMSTVIRKSVAHTIYLNAGDAADWLAPVVEPSPGSQPTGTQVQFAFRGANGFTGLGNNHAFDALNLNAYGVPLAGPATVSYFNNNSGWSSDINTIDGAQYVQVRITFVNNVVTQLNPELSAFGLAFER